MFDNCRVEAESVSDFLEKYYKRDRYHGRGVDYAAVVLAHHEKDFAELGYTIISRHESVTGNVVAYFDKNRPTQRAADVCHECGESETIDPNNDGVPVCVFCGTRR